jgi:hypothetical protein
MPFSPTKVFLEETSLVARPIIPFPELKLRMIARLAHLGIKVGGRVAGSLGLGRARRGGPAEPHCRQASRVQAACIHETG